MIFGCINMHKCPARCLGLIVEESLHDPAHHSSTFVEGTHAKI